MREGLLFTGRLEVFQRAPPTAKKPEDPGYFEGGWDFEHPLVDQKNLVVNTGYNTVADRIFDLSRTYSSTDFGYFAWSSGSNTPALADTASDFYADGTSDTKAVTSFDSFDTALRKQVVNCFLSSADNAVGSITKFALMNADPGTVMFNEIEFTAITKDATKEFYFRYSLTLSQA